MARSLFDRLDAEWASKCSSDVLATVPPGWAAEPDLAEFSSLSDVVAFVRGAARAESDLVLIALARRASEDTVAARTLLQLFLPACKKISAWRADGVTHDEMCSVVVAAVWEAVRNYPTTGATPRVAWRIVRAVTKAAQRAVAPRRELPFDEVPERHDGSERDDVRRRVGMLLELATRSGRLRPAEVRAVRAFVDGVPDPELAAAEECSLRTVRWRRQRAQARLRAAAVDGALAC